MSTTSSTSALPLSEPRRSHTTGRKSSKPLQRSATTIQTTHPPTTKQPIASARGGPPPTHQNGKHVGIVPQPPPTSRHASNLALNSNHTAPNGISALSSGPARHPRPGFPSRQPSVRTQYMTMLLDLDTIPRMHTIYSAFFTWVLLAGFVIIPGTFTSFSTSEKLTSSPGVGDIVKAVKNIPLLAIGGTCCGIGAVGMIWLWWRWKKNYVWLCNRIFLPGTLNSLAGLISSLVNIYSQQDGIWSITARITAIIIGSCMVITAILFGLYNFWALGMVKKRHERELGAISEHEDLEEGLVEKVERKMKEPALEPGSVV